MVNEPWNKGNVSNLSKVSDKMLADTVKKTIENREKDEPRKISHVLLEDIIDGQEAILDQLKDLNKNLAIIGAALLKDGSGIQG